jgi:hypothetical protein
MRNIVPENVRAKHPEEKMLEECQIEFRMLRPYLHEVRRWNGYNTAVTITIHQERENFI